MAELHPTYKRLISVYVETFMNACNIKSGRESTIQVWFNSFSYIDNTTKYKKFEKACKSLFEQEELRKMPLPGTIKAIIREQNREDESLGEKPIITDTFSDLRHKATEILGKIKTCLVLNILKDLKKEYYDLVMKMEGMTGNTAPVKLRESFKLSMTTDSYIDKRLKLINREAGKGKEGVLANRA